MATKKYLDENGLLYYHQKAKAEFVAQESGKGLSTNDYTTAEKTKLAGIESGAEVNDIDTIKVNGTAQTITSKAVDITVPTNNNQLTNGAGYQTSSDVQSAITTAISGITGVTFEVVQALPATGENGVIYLLSNGGSSPNIYDEYIWLSASSSFEKIGTTDVDLSAYATTEYVNRKCPNYTNITETSYTSGELRIRLEPDSYASAPTLQSLATGQIILARLTSSYTPASTPATAPVKFMVKVGSSYNSKSVYKTSGALLAGDLPSSAVDVLFWYNGQNWKIIGGSYLRNEVDDLLADKADAATTLAGYGITDAYTKTEVDGMISSAGEENVIEIVKVNGTALTPDANKAVDVTVPTKVSDLTNDSGFTTNTGTITGVSANGTSVATSGVANIPAASTSRYGVTKLSSSTSSTSTSLAATASAVKAAYDLADGKQDALTPGTNITISSGTISATDTTYTAGTGLTLSGTEFSLTDTMTAITNSEIDTIVAS